jgi:hypothetical protein
MTVRCGSVTQLPGNPIRSQVSCVTCTSVTSASAVIPENIVTARMPSMASVVAALRLFGGRNAGTPLAIASMPVSAVQPEENARSAKNSSANPARLVCPGSGSIAQDALSACGVSPNRIRITPVTMSTSTPAVNAYVGTANAVPDSRSPRRLAAASSATRPSESPTRAGLRSGNAEITLSTPADTDTATVST